MSPTTMTYLCTCVLVYLPTDCKAFPASPCTPYFNHLAFSCTFHLPSSIFVLPRLSSLVSVLPQSSHSFSVLYPTIAIAVASCSFIYYSMIDLTLSFSRWKSLHIVARSESKAQILPLLERVCDRTSAPSENARSPFLARFPPRTEPNSSNEGHWA